MASSSGLLAILFAVIIAVHAAEPTCPLCPMPVGTTFHYDLTHGQSVRFCDMDHDISDATAWLESIAVGPAENVYGDGPFLCPVCGMDIGDPHDAGVHRVAIKHGQSVYTCSASCAQELFDNTAAYRVEDGDEDEEEPFCKSATVMYNGFTFDGNGVCVRFLFEGWDLDSRGKLTAAIIGTICLGLLLEATLYTRRRVLGQGKYEEGYSTIGVNETDRLKITWKHKAIAGGLFVFSTAVAYLLMLIAMTYHAGLFIALISGLAIGHTLFRLETRKIESADPCCQP